MRMSLVKNNDILMKTLGIIIWKYKMNTGMNNPMKNITSNIGGFLALLMNVTSNTPTQ